MEQIALYLQNHRAILIALGLWSLAWKGLALWKSARKDQMYWFLAILVLNTVGLLPIAYLIYLKYFEKSDKKDQK